MFCKAGAMDLCNTFTKVNSLFPGSLKLAGIGMDLNGYDDFRSGGFFDNHDIYIDRNKDLYKAFKYKKPGCSSCWGFCNGGVYKRKKEVQEKYKDKKLGFQADFKKDLFQMGGSFLIAYNGEILLDHVEQFYGDHAKEQDILAPVKKYFRNNKNNLENLQEDKKTEFKNNNLNNENKNDIKIEDQTTNKITKIEINKK